MPPSVLGSLTNMMRNGGGGGGGGGACFGAPATNSPAPDNKKKQQQPEAKGSTKKKKKAQDNNNNNNNQQHGFAIVTNNSSDEAAAAAPGALAVIDNNDNDNDGSLGSDLALVTMGGDGVDDDMIAKQIESLRRSAVDLTKEQDGARQLAKKYAAESREWEGRYQRVNKQLEDRERDLLEIKTDVEKCMQMKTFFEEKFRMADAVISQCVDEVSTTKRLHERHTEDSVKNWERVQKDHTERCARTEQQLTEVTRRLEITDGEKRVALESSESLSQECKELTAKLMAATADETTVLRKSWSKMWTRGSAKAASGRWGAASRTNWATG